MQEDSWVSIRSRRKKTIYIKFAEMLGGDTKRSFEEGKNNHFYRESVETNYGATEQRKCSNRAQLKIETYEYDRSICITDDRIILCRMDS